MSESLSQNYLVTANLGIHHICSFCVVIKLRPYVCHFFFHVRLPLDFINTILSHLFRKNNTTI